MNKPLKTSAAAVAAAFLSLPLFLTEVHAVKSGDAKSVYTETYVDAPFRMPAIYEYTFPAREFDIRKYGARQDDVKANIKAFRKAVEACFKAGGGRVVVPAGEWHTGPIHLKSNVCLYLSDGAVVRPVDDPELYLPAVPTSWEGMECYNYSPLVYAYECVNVGIAGPGTIAPHMDLWKKWFRRPKPHMDALKRLYDMAATDVPVEKRQMAEGENHLRPHLIQFNRCRNVSLLDFKIRESPFWTIHLYHCDGAVARGLDVRAHGHNNDGIDIEMTSNVLVENCTFDQGDDAVVIKSGRNHDAWRLDKPTENVVVRNCKIVKGHVLLGIGSEISGGIRNVYMHNCEATDSVFRLMFIKTNHRRGAYVKNIYMDSVRAHTMQRVLEIDADVLYQWKDLVPTYKDSITDIDNINISNVLCSRTRAIYDLKGDARRPARNIAIRNIKVGKVSEFVGNVSNVENVEVSDLTYNQ